MHILFATPAFPPFMGGGENHAGSLARNLVERGHRVTVLTSLALSEADLWNGCGQVVELEKTGPDLTVIRVPIRPMPAAFRGLLAWRSSMVRLSTLPGTVSLLLKMAQRMPALAGLDEALSYIENPVNSVALNSAMRHQRHMLSCADMLITNTSKEASGLQAYGVKPNLVRVAGVGVDIPDFVAGPLPGADYPKPYVLFIGRTSYDKGAIHAAQAVLRLREQGSDIKLVLIGRDTEEFRHYHGGLSRSDQDAILAAGCVEESIKHACLKEAEALLLPSRCDSFGMVLLEAWLYRRPVIAAEAGGIPGVVDNGKNGILVPFGDIPLLANAIQLLTGDPELNRALGENGYRKLMENYTWDRVTDRVLDAYRDVFNAKA